VALSPKSMEKIVKFGHIFLTNLVSFANSRIAVLSFLQKNGVVAKNNGKNCHFWSHFFDKSGLLGK
jgi:hypothetical protein